MHGVILLVAGSAQEWEIKPMIKSWKILETAMLSECVLAYLKIQQITNVVIVFRDQKQKEKLESEINRLPPLSKHHFSSSKVVRKGEIL